jgi:uncharacterized protein (TIGR02271 family)
MPKEQYVNLLKKEPENEAAAASKQVREEQAIQSTTPVTEHQTRQSITPAKEEQSRQSTTPVTEHQDRQPKTPIKEDQNTQSSIPVIEEQAHFEKKVIETGKVHISKVVYEDVDNYAIPTAEEQVSVERIPKNVIVDVAPGVRYEGDVMIIPVLKEVAVVEKKIMLVEEIRVTKTKTEKTENREIALKREEVKVERSK